MAGQALTTIHLWTDGSGTVQGKPGGWGFVLIGNGTKRVVSGCSLDATNNQMEMGAVLNGLKAITRRCHVIIHTDSEYVMKAFTEGWIEAWRKRDWRKVKNVEHWHRLIAEVERHEVEWEWCKGHDGNLYNEVCDRIAGEARMTQQPTDSGRVPLLAAAA